MTLPESGAVVPITRAAARECVRKWHSHHRPHIGETGWWVTATVSGSPWTHGANALRWLPGMYEPSTEIVDRLRWERGKDAAPPAILDGGRVT